MEPRTGPSLIVDTPMECQLRAYYSTGTIDIVPFVDDGTEESAVNAWFNKGVTMSEYSVRFSFLL